MSAPDVQRCTGCGGTIRPEDWSDMPFVGIQDCEGDGPDLELRNHSCGSTIAIEVP